MEFWSKSEGQIEKRKESGLENIGNNVSKNKVIKTKYIWRKSLLISDLDTRETLWKLDHIVYILIKDNLHRNKYYVYSTSFYGTTSQYNEKCIFWVTGI